MATEQEASAPEICNAAHLPIICILFIAALCFHAENSAAKDDITSEIDILKKELAEKDAYILQLQIAFDKLFKEKK